MGFGAQKNGKNLLNVVIKPTIKMKNPQRPYVEHRKYL